MLRAVERLSASLSEETHLRFVSFLQRHTMDVDPKGGPAHESLYLPHRAARPAEYATQGLLGIHPRLDYARQIGRLIATFDEDPTHHALAAWARYALDEQTNVVDYELGEALELWLLDRPTNATLSVVEGVALEWLRRADTAQDLSVILPNGASAFLMLACELVGPPSHDVLERMHTAFGRYSDDVYGSLPPALLLLGTLLWRALDHGVLRDSRMRDYVDSHPDLVRVIESHMVRGGTRASALVPIGSRSERFLERLCLQRLDNVSDQPIHHTMNGPIKGISLWPGREGVLRALRRLNEMAEPMVYNERTESLGSSLWHVLRHSRPRPGDTLPADELSRLSDRAIVAAAAVAPWWAGDLEQVRDWNGLRSLVAWGVAHSRAALKPEEQPVESPWIERQARATIGDFGRFTQAQRDEGIVEREWFAAAVAELGEERALEVIRQMAAVLPFRTDLEDVAATLLGRRSAARIDGGGDEVDPADVKAHGLVPLSTAANRLEAETAARFDAISEYWNRQADEFIMFQKAINRRAAVIAVTNLAAASGLDDPLLLAWSRNAVSFERIEAALPYEHERYRVEAALDEDGEPTLHVRKLWPSERILKTVPREVQEAPGYQAVRMALADLQPTLRAMRTLFERRLITSTPIAAETLARLLKHPFTAVLVENLVFLDEDVSCEGMPRRRKGTDEMVLLGPDGTEHEVRPGAELVLAHPVALEARRTMRAWRETLISQRLRQPFPQLYREVERPKASSRARKIGAFAGMRVRMAVAAETLRELGWSLDSGITPRRVFSDHGLLVHWPFQHIAHAGDLFATGDGETGELRFVALNGDQSRTVREVPDVVVGEVLRDAALTLVTARPGDDDEAWLPASVRDTQRALLDEFVGMVVARVRHRVPVDAEIGDTVVTVRFEPDGEMDPLVVEVSLINAGVRVAGRPANVPLPALRRAPYTPHPLRTPLREAVTTLARVFDAIDHKHAGFYEAVRRQMPVGSDARTAAPANVPQG